MATYEYCALEFLDMWMLHESRFRAAILGTSEDQQLEGLDKAARYFRIARNLHRKYDTDRGEPRYRPILDLIGTLATAPQTPAQTIHTVGSFAVGLSSRYGERLTLSAASKILWLLIRDPIIIYDGQAQWSLGTPYGDYGAFVTAWEQRWDQDQRAIEAACATLPNMFQYALCGDLVSRDQVQRISSARWFHRRALDVRLWTEGREANALSDELS